ncbi:MAG: glycosyltransferase family 39 protein, partial [Pseudomonadota bacterium]
MITKLATDQSKNTMAVLLIALIILSSCAFFYKLGEPDIYHIRLESRRAEIARNMVETGNWLVPQIAGDVILTKPPLYFWSVGLCSLKTGVNEFTARVPSALAGIGTIIFTFLLGSLLFSRRSGAIAALALLITNIFLFEARYAEMESMLTFFITGSLYFFFKGYKDQNRAKFWFALFFAMMGLGTMTKGPFAFTFPLIPVILYLFTYGERKLLTRKPFLSGLIFFFLIVLPWVVLIVMKYPDFFKLVAWETVAYYGKGEGGHREPFYYYFKTIFGTMFPWVFILPFSVWIAFSAKLRSIRRENVFLMLWLLGNFIFLTGSKSKRDFYLDPLAPGLALLIGSTWEALWERAREKIRYSPAVITWICFFAGAAFVAASFVAASFVAASFAVKGHELLSYPGKELPRSSSLLVFLGLNCMLAAGIKIFISNIPGWKAALASLATVILALHFFNLTYTTPIRNAEESGRNFFVHAAHIIKKSDPLAYYASIENFAFSFYAHRLVKYIKEEDAAVAFMASPEKKYLVLTARSLENFDESRWRVVLKSSYSKEHPG